MSLQELRRILMTSSWNVSLSLYIECFISPENFRDEGWGVCGGGGGGGGGGWSNLGFLEVS